MLILFCDIIMIVFLICFIFDFLSKFWNLFLYTLFIDVLIVILFLVNMIGKIFMIWYFRFVGIIINIICFLSKYLYWFHRLIMFF